MHENPYVPDRNPWDKLPKIRDPKVPPEDYFHKNPSLERKPLTIADLFPRIDRWGIGLLDSLESLKTIAEAKPSYPPYNITREGNVWEIALAVAGFRKDELEIEVQESTLTVRTNPNTDFERKDIREVIHQGIAQRNFDLKFALAEHVEVKGADLKDGLLRIKLEQKLPKEKQPKSITIN